MNVKCYQEIPSVKLADGRSPLEGLVVIESGKYVCYDGFTDKAAELVCEELGFPAAKGFTGHSSLASMTTATRHRIQVVSCRKDSLRVMDCLTATECFSNRIVRLQCREPAFLGCYKDNQLNFQTEFNTGFGVDSEISVGFCDHPEIVPNGSWDTDITSFGSKITLICDKGYTVNGSAILQCVGLPGWSTYFPDF
ncbi:lysyl oxidase homolog 3-like [Diadema antillarum]|uniref:lysyl oxidase homolog 3-like n=1 Tax=Diadema antillarum TaxID=105358 RepID=UPI003A8C7392